VRRISRCRRIRRLGEKRRAEFADRVLEIRALVAALARKIEVETVPVLKQVVAAAARAACAGGAMKLFAPLLVSTLE
jgi:hypothetical protein